MRYMYYYTRYTRHDIPKNNFRHMMYIHPYNLKNSHYSNYLYKNHHMKKWLFLPVKEWNMILYRQLLEASSLQPF